ncbi:PREDICTED: coagulation factor X-like isoform X2 [Polistes dominula]|uniref:Coagulation factor X-like isoform X2 n=1 Tax=Polistes dominula TaxID=743375 RepID=A0ABM1J6Y8_POLDO|nr:PREDICTED: coagulation factor X-like isoform X2 [Polistes dominula]
MDIVNRKSSFLIAFGYFLIFISPSIVTVQANVCTVPPQPANGYRQLYRLQCQSQQNNCYVQEGTKLPILSHLIYTCNTGYQISGSSDVFCDREGNWLNIPVCTEIRCKSLASASTDADCKLNGQWISCESPVLPGTTAELSCRNSYEEVGNFLSKHRNQVTCNNTGQWEPQPIECFPKCGVVPSKSKPLIIGGNITELSQFPWHATLYQQKTSNGSKNFICGATIIKENLLLTAAHCIYDESNRKIENPNKYYVATGNIYRDYDSTLHKKRFVKKARVKGIYVPCNYLGFEGNYAWDIAILEIERPFVLSSSLLPACLNGDLIESGLGVVSGFGRTAEGSSSFVLQSVSLPYVPLSQCKSSKNSIESEKFITMDKFCAGYTNGTSVCDGDSGGGLVFQTGNLWFLRGIVSLSLDEKLTGGTRICDSHSYTLYTRISTHINWIQDTLFQLETSKPLPSCRDSTIANVTFVKPDQFIPISTSTITSSSSIQNTTVCTAPPDPANGYRLLHKLYCPTQKDCTVKEGIELVSGSHLIYTCNQGYELRGISDVLCSPEGEWLNIPVCTEIRCKSLASQTRFAECKYNDEWTSCESDVLAGTITKEVIGQKTRWNVSQEH